MWREKSRCNSSSDFFPCRPQRDAARETDKRIAHTARDTQLSVRHGRKNMVSWCDKYWALPSSNQSRRVASSSHMHLRGYVTREKATSIKNNTMAIGVMIK